MPFEDLEIINRQNMPPVAKLSYLHGTRKGAVRKDDAKPKLTVSIPTVICISKAEKFVLQLGTGADRGKMRLVGLKKGVPGAHSVKPREFKKHFLFRFGYVPKLGDEIFDDVRCSIVRIDDDQYELTLPANFSFGPSPTLKTVDGGRR